MPTMLLKSVSTSHAVRKGTGMAIVASTRKVSPFFSTATRISGSAPNAAKLMISSKRTTTHRNLGMAGSRLVYGFVIFYRPAHVAQVPQRHGRWSLLSELLLPRAKAVEMTGAFSQDDEVHARNAIRHEEEGFCRIEWAKDGWVGHDHQAILDATGLVIPVSPSSAVGRWWGSRAMPPSVPANRAVSVRAPLQCPATGCVSRCESPERLADRPYSPRRPRPR